jgi:hypothetical protein
LGRFVSWLEIEAAYVSFDESVSSEGNRVSKLSSPSGMDELGAGDFLDPDEDIFVGEVVLPEPNVMGS